MTYTPTGLSLTFPVERYRPGPDQSITDIERLRRWRLDAGLPESPVGDMTLEETLEFDGITFPLDADEIRSLNSFYDLRETWGTLSLTIRGGTAWETDASP